MAEENDKSSRLLFSYPEMVEWLIRRFVPGPWIDRLDFSRLEKVSEREVSDELIRREKDLLWRLPYRTDDEGEGWFFVYLHFEFQGRGEALMAVREMVYKGLVWQALERQGLLLPGNKLPPVLSFVVYNGEARWDDVLSVTELIEPLPGMEASDLPPGFAPDSYLVIDAQSYPFAELERDANPVTTWFQAEPGRGFEDLRRAALKLKEQLQDDRYRGLRRAFATRFRQVLIPAIAPEGPTPGGRTPGGRTPGGRTPGRTIPEVEELTEVASMLQERVIQWRDAWVEEGREEGRIAGEAAVLLRQLEMKFGPLPEWARDRIAAADAEQLLAWAVRLLSAESLEAVFD